MKRTKNRSKYIMLSIVIPVTLIITGILAFPGKSADSQKVQVRRFADLDNQPAARRYQTSYRQAGMSDMLHRLSDVYNTGGQVAALEFAARRSIPVKNGQALILMELAAPVFLPDITGSQRTTNANTMESREAALKEVITQIKPYLEELGATITKSHRHMVRCSVPFGSLAKIPSIPMVRSIRQPIKLRPHVQSEGVSHSGAYEFHKLPSYHGTPVKVCVLDVGFEGYKDMLGTELPENVTVQSFREDGDIEAGIVHGSACAEIVYDMAPEAEIYLANVEYDTDVYDAFDWILENDIDIITYSIGYYAGPGDGTGVENDLAQRARELGILWVASAGNEADGHWSGYFNDSDNDGWHNFADDDEILEFYVPKEYAQEETVQAYLKWDDWGTWDEFLGYSGSNQDYDLYLLYWDGTQWIIADSSQNRQPDYKWPFEEIYGWTADFDTWWGVAIRKHAAAKELRFDLYVPTHELGTVEYNMPSGSITPPADSPNIISVGAVDAIRFTYHEYSSQGPTLDGRMKPEICAGSGVSTYTYGRWQEGGFYGTSASAPCFAGAVALLKSKTPFTLDEIIQIIYTRADDMGETGPDNIFGYGSMNLRGPDQTIFPE